VQWNESFLGELPVEKADFSAALLTKKREQLRSK
jgi:hypothetical protein